MKDHSFWRQKCVIITGASSGIGWALARGLAQRGASLGLVSRRAEKLAELATAIESAGGRATFAAADVTAAEPLKRACQTLEEALGPCEILIASAGIHLYSPGYDFSAKNANAVFATNVQGIVNSIAAVLPGMIARRRGHLVAVASIAGMLGLPDVGAYSASKAAVVTLMESLRVDLHARGVKVTTICPGFIDTPMIADHAHSALLFVLPPKEAARRIAGAIERARPEYWFPWPLWLAARVGRILPFGLYRRVCRWLPRRVLSDSEGPASAPRGDGPV